MSSSTLSKIGNQKVLIASVILAVVFASIALTVGLLTSSQVIVFDGLISFIGVGLSYLSILAMKFIRKKDTWNYPFGKQALEPFVVIVQYIIILIVSVSTIFDAIQVLFDGGQEINLLSGVLYGAFIAVYTLLSIKYLRHLTNGHPSAVGELEIEQWKFSFHRALGVLGGFGTALLLSRTPLVTYTVYVDPVLLILVTLVFIKTAIKSIYHCTQELLNATPSEETTAIVQERINVINSQYSFSDVVIRLGKAGRQLIVEIDYVIEEDSELDSIFIQDKIRDKLTCSLAGLPYEKWINVTFIGHIKWSEHMSE